MAEQILPNLRILPLRKPLRRGAKTKWATTSFRFSPELLAFLKADAKEENVDVTYLVTEICEQYKAFKTVKKKGRR